MSTTTRDEKLAHTLARLTERRSNQHDGAVVALPSWSGTAALLDDLHRLLLADLDRAEAGKRLVNANEALQAQIRACKAAWPDAMETSRACGEFMQQLPGVRETLQEDIQAALRGDPAATGRDEVILCYPGLRALTCYRVARTLYKLGVPLLPRLMTEIGHSQTGIDIHPGAAIGRRFFIDHGTGVVIGETCIIGDDVKIYQGVTLGARSFPTTGDGQVVSGIERHPVIGNRVTIYAGATILGRIRVGDDSVVGGNVWITRDVPSGSHLRQRRPHSDS